MLPRPGFMLTEIHFRRAARAISGTPAFLLLVLATTAAAQTTDRPPDRLKQDDLDLQVQSNIVQGSGARAFGMGGAFLARADDATAASWNPAGLSYLRRPEVSLVGARNSFDRGPAGESPDDTFKGYTPDFMAAAYPLEFGPVAGSVQVSYQRVFSFVGERQILESAP